MSIDANFPSTSLRGVALILVIGAVAYANSSRANDGIAEDIRRCEKEQLLDNTSEKYIRENAPHRIESWRIAANNGSPEGNWLIGRCFAIGAVEAQSMERAVSHYTKAAESGFPIAQYSLGRLYSNGESGIKKNERMALQLYRQAAEKGYALAQAALAFRYMTGTEHVEKDEDEAVRLYRKAAGSGLVTSQFELSLLYRNGKCKLPQDSAVAIQWMRKAADLGYMPAIAALAQWAHWEGVETLSKEETARALWNRSQREFDSPSSHMTMGLFYMQRRFQGIDEELYSIGKLYSDQIAFRKALPHFLKAAEGGVQYANYNAGMTAIYIGEFEAGLHLLRLGADENTALAMMALSVCSELGVGCKVDKKESRNWASQAKKLNPADFDSEFADIRGKIEWTLRDLERRRRATQAGVDNERIREEASGSIAGSDGRYTPGTPEYDEANYGRLIRQYGPEYWEEYYTK